MSQSKFSKIEQAPDDAIFGLVTMYKADESEKKLNLSVGAYRTNDGKPYVLSVVKKAELLHLSDLNNRLCNKEYLPIDGLPAFRKASAKIVFGESLDRVATVQALSGTGSLRLAFDFLRRNMEYTGKVYCSNPTWGNHKALIEHAGLTFGTYTYITESMTFDFEGMVADLKALPEGSAVVLHACAHNPTGVDPTQEQWKEILEVVQELGHLPIFDSAYQGFATGNLENDAFAVRMAVDMGMQLLVCQSFSKNLGLYNERIGALHVLCADETEADAVRSQLKLLIRPMYSNPPAHGASIVATIINTPELYQEWQNEMQIMSERILKMRHLLVETLKMLNTPGDWDHILRQVGMFSFTGLSAEICDVLREKYHIYMLRNGRISLAGVSTSTCSYLGQSIHEAITGETPSDAVIAQIDEYAATLKGELKDELQMETHQHLKQVVVVDTE